MLLLCPSLHFYKQRKIVNKVLFPRAASYGRVNNFFFYKDGRLSLIYRVISPFVVIHCVFSLPHPLALIGIYLNGVDGVYNLGIHRLPNVSKQLIDKGLFCAVGLLTQASCVYGVAVVGSSLLRMVLVGCYLGLITAESSTRRGGRRPPLVHPNTPRTVRGRD